MSLFAVWRGTLDLPALPERGLKVGGNRIVQRIFDGVSIKAQIAPSQIRGHDLITTELSPPYREILLRRKGANRVDTSLPVLVAPGVDDPDNLPVNFEIQWDSQGELVTYANTPEKVLDSWINRFDFRTEDEERDLPGLRTPQIGALHAISAHFAVGSTFEPATVVLPTGTGKTETMLATLVYRRLKRTLVLVPSVTLRTQISEKFISLGVLPDAQVIPHDLAKPHVAIITTGIKSTEELDAIIQNANVIVALPNVLEASDAEIVCRLADACSDLIVDEAHHITADTWQRVRVHFATKRILQFTATPFRRDGKRVDGKIIFNYKLGDAQAAGYYRAINLRTIEEYGDEEARDVAIAKEAISVLRHDRDYLKLDHLLMARTSSKSRAEAVGRIYQRLAPDLKPVIVYSGSGRTLINRMAMTQLFDRSDAGARIVVCVDMLGEGFDLPYLKVAALHDTHKSLAVTLQFIGRFTRKGPADKIGEASVVVNIADPDAEAKLASLYAEGADWDRLIKRLSEERIAQELRLQDVVLALKESGNLHTNLSLWNLRPALSAQLFRTRCSEWSPLAFRSVLPKGSESWYALSEPDNVLVSVVCRSSDVAWGNYQNFYDTIYDLLIIKWDKVSGALFIFASDYDALRSEKIAKAITSEETALVSGTPIFNILNNVELPLVKSLGSSRIGAISFTSYFGPNVTEGLASIEKAESSLNNLACLGYENGERVLWGGTQRRGKVWQQKSGTISDWIEWTTSTWVKVSSEVESESNIVRDFLRPEKIARPHSAWPISAQWGEQAQMRFNDRQFVIFGSSEIPVFAVDLTLGDVGTNGEIVFRIESDEAKSEYALVISEEIPGGYRHDHISGPAVTFRHGTLTAVPLEEYLQKDPFIVRYSDGTYSYNCYHIPVKLDAGLYQRDKLESWDWDGIELNKESMHKVGNQKTIQFRTFEQINGEFDIIFNDDGHGEAADLVCLKDVDDNTIRLCLVHCKGAHEARVSKDIRNFYIVCGQAQKSIAAKHAGLPALYHDLKRRQETWVREGHNRFLKGNIKDLSYFKEKSRRARLEFEMILVQPGGSVASITDDALRLLATTELYLLKTTQAKLRVVLSP
ncbi:Superfamily II DNA or RNA helicase [Pseudomonas citronellolis]|uniref:Superfamily II DNA or RNA helicase n=1 Tax=Pseudomonas citronellolis TaxID=53408 RepID=A0AAQ1R130_9PSED|nr:DEAD/DEAH box helicase family protein [Pseudomonas citronellolis]TGC32228.1 DEAD/DEAH box helicase [Pseudomonas citronellolis]SFD89897.1 Superfamily II DNA or RNA helicase [Pseudomonas citronellolis]